MKKKIISLAELSKIRKKLKQQGKKVVFTNGCFDLLHSGHIHLFREAKEYGDILVVAVNDDFSIKKIKGASRPIFPLEERLEILEAIEEIDYLTHFSEETPQKIIAALVPDVLVKGGDWKPDEVVGKREVEGAGGEVKIVPYREACSTSDIIDRIVRSAK
ncbi:MAG: D-glycero-beta-D-manno-heptose 1-phosphate adenylyltransferase [Candidatus Aminicenantes bacterium]|nr:MAG: D-glycero-beta-D-manno-heptose 1-phosphate adenylyltransferase [Candidatus Aminicenantes bacterium]